MEHDPVWLAVGFFGQGLFSMRFVIQWFTSERARKSIVPRAFWYFSLAVARRCWPIRFIAATRCSSSGKARASSSTCATCG